MSEPFRSVRFHCSNYHDQQIEGPVVNPADWFGKVWLVEIPHGPVLAVEADHEQAAIDVLADSLEYGHWINDPDGKETAGNDDHPVDTTMVRVSPSPLGLTYQVNWSPRFWQKTDMIQSSIYEHDREEVI